ncbi:hypothetical protein ACFL0L_01155 [Patescibacteria group bacterium]
MNRRILLIIAFIIVVIIIGILIYFVFFKDFISPANNAINNAGVNGELPISNDAVNRITINEVINRLPLTNDTINVNVQAQPDRVAQGGATIASLVTQDTTLGAVIDADGLSIVYYDPVTGKFYRISNDGKTKVELSDKVFHQVDTIDWSPNRNEAIITFPDGSKILYNFLNDTQVTLPKEWDDVEFSPEGNQVAYKYLAEDEDSRWLAIANPDGTEVRGIEPIGDKGDDVQVAWSPSNQSVALFHESSGTSSEEVLPIGFHGENYKSFSVDGRGFEGQWSPTGDRVLYSTYSSDTNFNPTLSIVDAQGQDIGLNHQQMSIQTWANKCTFSNLSNVVYCAVPQSLPEGSGIYPELAETVPDTFWQIDLQNGIKSRLADPVTETGGGSFTAKSISLSSDERYLYFTDASTGRVHKIQIR